MRSLHRSRVSRSLCYSRTYTYEACPTNDATLDVIERRSLTVASEKKGTPFSYVKEIAYTERVYFAQPRRLIRYNRDAFSKEKRFRATFPAS